MRLLLFFLLLFCSHGVASFNYTESKTIIKLYQIMKDIHELFQEEELEYWCNFGTLLGAVRHGGIIPWDDDLDICINNKQEAQLLALKPTLDYLGYGLGKTAYGYTIYPLDGTEIPGTNKLYPYLDIFLMHEKNNNLYHQYSTTDNPFIWGKRDGGPIYIRPEELFPLKNYTFGSLSIKGPANGAKRLNYIYGTQWNTSAMQDHTHNPALALDELAQRQLDNDMRQPARPYGPLQETVSTYLKLYPKKTNYDAVIVGFVNFADGMGRQPITLCDCLKDAVSLGFINTRGGIKDLDLTDVPERIKTILTSYDRVAKYKVALFTDVVVTNNFDIVPDTFYKQLPKSTIKLAFTKFESNTIPKSWVKIFNSTFDALIVPDKCLVSVYQKSGVTLPIFVLPPAMYLDEFLEQPVKATSHKPFVFATTAAFDPRKNHVMLLDAFAQAFKNNPQVTLKINGRNQSPLLDELKAHIKKLGLTNVEITANKLSWQDYTAFMSSFDCYISVSKGEGYSLQGRESLALGIPVIAVDNSSQSTLCNSGFICPVAAQITIPAYYPHLKETVGSYSVCKLSHVSQAMKAVFNNYQLYLKKAQGGRKWVEHYNYKNLKNTYITLVKPKAVTLGSTNTVTADCLITNSLSLYNKYTSAHKADN
ncbi:LicD family protein [Candidatus Dependentiae bacterium]|nr:LicD family protein [Candidatus Dependentiae bacterium]